MAAKEKEVSELHNLLTQRYLKILKSDEEFSPQILAQIAKFLKDNDITSDMEENEDLAQLKAKAKPYPFTVVEQESVVTL